jgi:hypothetical protein
MGLLPAVPMLLLVAFAAWFFWPLLVDPILRVTNPQRRGLRRHADRIADDLFNAWTERG